MNYLILNATVINKDIRHVTTVSGGGGGGHIYDGIGDISPINISSNSNKITEITFKFENGSQFSFDIKNINIPLAINDHVLLLLLDEILWSIKLNNCQIIDINNINEKFLKVDNSFSSVFSSGFFGLMGGGFLGCLGTIIVLFFSYNISKHFANKLNLSNVFLPLFLLFFSIVFLFSLNSSRKQSSDNSKFNIKIHEEYKNIRDEFLNTNLSS